MYIYTHLHGSLTLLPRPLLQVYEPIVYATRRHRRIRRSPRGHHRCYSVTTVTSKRARGTGTRYARATQTYSNLRQIGPYRDGSSSVVV